MIVRAMEREIDLEMEKKRKLDYVSSVEVLGKRPKVVDTGGMGQQG